VRALEAGVDVLLMPTDADAAINGVLAAIKSGRLTEARINQSVRKILAAKARLGLAANRQVNVESISETLESPDAEARAQETADRAVTLVRNQGAPLPLRQSARPCLFVLVDSRFSQQGRQLIQEVTARSPQAEVRTLDASVPQIELEEAVQLAGGCDASIVAAFVTASAYRGNVALPGALPEFVHSLIAAKPPVVFLAFGNPYLLRAFPNVASYMAMFSTVPVAENAAAKALFGEIAIRGRMPVTIPELAKIGDGIQIAALQVPRR
jgi:beta-N-acetylhexosaminidase